MTDEATPSYAASQYLDPYQIVPPGAPLPARDPNKTDKAQGLYEKFVVRRVDGNDAPGFKHHNCEYFVLDVTHDPHAQAALRGYIASARLDYPALSVGMVNRYRITLEDGTDPSVAATLIGDNAHLHAQNARLNKVVAARQDVSAQLRNANVTVLLENNSLKKQVASMAAVLSLIEDAIEEAHGVGIGSIPVNIIASLINQPGKALERVLSDDAVNPWKSAIMSELMISHAHRPEHDTQPLRALHDLIAIIDSTSLDPAVSVPARNFGADLLIAAYNKITARDDRPYNQQHHSLTGMARNFREYGVLVPPVTAAVKSV